MNLTMRWQDWVWLVGIAAMFASSFIFHKLAIPEIPPFTIAAGRVVISIPVALVAMGVLGLRLPTQPAQWGQLGVLATTGVVVPFVAIAWGQQHIEAGLGGILMATIPLFTVGLAPWLTPDEGFSLPRGLGALGGLAGVVLVVGPLALAGVGGYLAGALVTLLAPLGYALTGIFVRRYGAIHPITLNGGQLLVGAVVLVPLAAWQDHPWGLSPSWPAMAGLVGIGMFGTVIPQLMFFPLVRRVGATNSSPLSLMITIFTVFYGAILLGELLPWNAFVGMALILGGAWFITGGGFRRKTQRG